MKRSLVFSAILGLAFVASTAEAQPKPPRFACVNRGSGAIELRTKCRTGEERLSTKTLAAMTIGVQGPQGPAGLPGARGEMGPIGPQGPVGPAGAQGEIGPVGPRGETGPQGPMGARGEVGPAGARGETGAQGPVGPRGEVGPQGPIGPRGPSAFETMPSGTTVYGAVGALMQVTGANQTVGATESLHAMPTTAHSNASIIVANTNAVDSECGGRTCLADEEFSRSALCTGTIDSPSAPPGYLCIYPAGAENAKNIRATALPNDRGSFGFYLRWDSHGAGGTSVRGVWAYQAP